jgi:uncharacterized protein
MDPVRGVCIGCCRTLDEIARWAGMTEAERERVLAALPSRKAGPEDPVSTPATATR